MTHTGLWYVRYETTAVGEKHVAADTPQEAMGAVVAHEQGHATPRRPAVTVHFTRIERIGTVMIP